MLIVALKESTAYEKRVAMTPEIAKKYTELNYKLSLESDAGKEAGYLNQIYEKANVTVLKDRDTLLKQADILLSAAPVTEQDIQGLKEGVVVIGLLKPHQNSNLLAQLAKKRITSFSLELIPRITRAQGMDVLSSQSNLAGYKAVIDAASHFKRALPLMMTAAGTIAAARVLILGAGVAGLQAIATAKRLGAIVSAFDVRSTAKEQVESLGGTFVQVDDQESGDAHGGYAKEMSESYKQAQAQKLAEVVKTQDIIITTAQIPGKPAPLLVTSEMVKSMKPGSVIVDLAAESGGNCSDTVWGKSIVKEGVTLIAPANILSSIATDASQLYSRNIYNFIKILFQAENLTIAWQDEIVQATALTHEGQIIHPQFNLVTKG